MARTTRTAGLVALARALRGATRPGEPGLRERLASVPRLLRATASGEYTGTSRGRLATAVLAVLYVASPVDLVPEMVLPLVGLADDAVVLTWLVARVLTETDAFLSWERLGGARRSASDDVVPGHVVR